MRKQVSYIGDEREEDQSNFIQAVAGIAQGVGSITTGVADMATAGKKAKMQEENNRSMLTSQILAAKANKQALKAKGDQTLLIVGSIVGVIVLGLAIFLIIKFKKK